MACNYFYSQHVSPRTEELIIGTVRIILCKGIPTRSEDEYLDT